MKDKTILELATRINEIRVEQQKLEIEYNSIVKELWDRIPSLKDDPNLQIKEKTKGKTL